MHRERTRFRAGESALLALVLEPAPTEGVVVVDVGASEELHAVAVTAGGAVRVGAFASPQALAEPAPHLCPPGAGAAEVRLRLALYDARVTVYGLGRTRVAPVEGLVLAPYELPAVIEVPAPRAGLGIAERRILQRDGAASFALGVTVALRVSLLGRFEHVRILLDLDGSVRRANEAEAGLEKQRCERDRFPEIARLAASSIAGDDARSSAIARALVPLVMAGLRDAFADARAGA
jgi:CO/xanthine dehydrogenase FAD-binding subunit